MSAEEVPCPAVQLQMETLPSLEHGRAHYSLQPRWLIVRRCCVACLATSYLPFACLHRRRTLSGWYGHSMRRESRAPRPVKDSYGSVPPKSLVDGSRQSPSFVLMD